MTLCAAPCGGHSILERGKFHLLSRSIGAYEGDFLKTPLPVRLGRDWMEPRNVARRRVRCLGFARTGATIEATVKNLIAGLLPMALRQRAISGFRLSPERRAAVTATAGLEAQNVDTKS